MKSHGFNLRLLAALLTFAASILLVTGWLTYSTGDVSYLEDRDCFRTDPAVTSVRCTPPETPLDFCGLISQPDRYESKIVRVRAVFAGYHHAHLFGRSCDEPAVQALVDYETNEIGIRLMTEIGNLPDVKARGEFDKVEVIVIGRFEAHNSRKIVSLMEWFGDEEMQRRLHPADDRFLFTITDVEQVGSY